MRKLIIVTAISVFFGILNSTLRAQESEKTFEDQLLDVMKKQIIETETQHQEIKKIHNSITGIRIQSSNLQDDNDLLLTQPKYIYVTDKQSEISEQFPKLIKDIQTQEEESFQNTVYEIRKFIENRSQYAAVLDKIVSLQVFDEVENRFMHIAQYLMKVRDTEDLKSIAELQLHIKSIFAMIQNETTKLQMVAHLRDAEQKLIDQQKYKRNVKILSHNNKQMPTIKVRYIQAAGIQ